MRTALTIDEDEYAPSSCARAVRRQGRQRSDRGRSSPRSASTPSMSCGPPSARSREDEGHDDPGARGGNGSRGAEALKRARGSRPHIITWGFSRATRRPRERCELAGRAIRATSPPAPGRTRPRPHLLRKLRKRIPGDGDRAVLELLARGATIAPDVPQPPARSKEPRRRLPPCAGRDLQGCSRLRRTTSWSSATASRSSPLPSSSSSWTDTAELCPTSTCARPSPTPRSPWNYAQGGRARSIPRGSAGSPLRQPAECRGPPAAISGSCRELNGIASSRRRDVTLPYLPFVPLAPRKTEPGPSQYGLVLFTTTGGRVGARRSRRSSSRSSLLRPFWRLS